MRFWRLPWVYDARVLQGELDRIDAGLWRTHFNTGYHDGGWSGLALISQDGNSDSLYSGPDAIGGGRGTDLLERCPSMHALLAALPVTIQSARLLKLAPGSHIREHSDHGIGLEAGSVRLHVPIVTAAGVEFYVDGVHVPMAEGECWYLDLGLPHRVQNGASCERIHLVIDCVADDRLRAMLPTPQASEQQLQEITHAALPTSQQRFEAFRDELLQQQPERLGELADIDDLHDLIARVVRLGGEGGYRFTAEDVRSSYLAGRRAWIERHIPGAATAQPAPALQPARRPAGRPADPGPDFGSWLPVMAQAQGERLMVDLCRLGNRRLTEPFFEDSIATCMRLPFHSLFRHRVDVDVLGRWLQDHPGLAPTGFIFHMSRCGSTLLAQVLAASPQQRVISEPAPLDAALRDGSLPAGAPQRSAWLTTLLGLLGRPANEQEQRYYLKFDSWHASHLSLIRRAYPDVPWVFMIRDPVEVIVSHLRHPGAQMVPGMLGFTPPGVDPLAALTMPREEYCAAMLGAICREALGAIEQDPARGLIVDYADLGDALLGKVLPHLGVPPDSESVRQIDAVRRRDAKNPMFEFQSDTESKQREASDAVRHAAERWVLPAYRRLAELGRHRSASAPAHSAPAM